MDLINKMLGISDSYQAPARIMEILLEWQEEERHQLFMDFIEAHKYDLSYDWWHEYFQEEHADRKNKKQDFTPPCISTLLTELLGKPDGIIYEPTAGTGSMIIKAWWQNCLKSPPWARDPLSQFYILEELSDKTVPFLLFNMAIRGINANVIHGNTLSRKTKAVYHVQNHKDAMSFSEVHVLPKSDVVEKAFNVKFGADMRKE